MKRISVADHGSGVQPARKDLAKLVKEVYDAVPAAAEVGNTRLEGRKMMLKWGLDRKAMAVEGADGAESAKISGKGRNALNKQIRSAQEKLNQDDRNLMKKLQSSKKPLEAAKELLNVMATDYTGPTAHKPPIHN
ncbi:hypothetical protein COLO4_28839 [Corchorus olitorius]|uniref:Uncharacterized protein n=1 Tax=Corchorus olitorius TaxID=93759 RepID=A0A1R3HI45_9ROSI|nr:hypothetical protein COLO4_28839 [Corchorus olitorius]